MTLIATCDWSTLRVALSRSSVMDM